MKTPNFYYNIVVQLFADTHDSEIIDICKFGGDENHFKKVKTQDAINSSEPTNWMQQYGYNVCEPTTISGRLDEDTNTYIIGVLINSLAKTGNDRGHFKQKPCPLSDEEMAQHRKKFFDNIISKLKKQKGVVSL